MIKINGLNQFQKIKLLGCLSLIMAALVACGTLEVGIETDLPTAGDVSSTNVPRPTPSEPAYETAVHATFGDQIELVGYSLNQVDPGNITATLIWKALTEIHRDYVVFIHAVDSDDQLVAQVDGDPAGGARPTSTWSVGHFVSDQHSLSLPEGKTVGDLTLRVGLYDAVSGDRLESDSPTFTELPMGSEGNPGNQIVETTVPPTQDLPTGGIAEEDEQTVADPLIYPLQIAYVKNDNAWLWTENSGIVALTTQGGVEGVLLSDDGQRVAFWRGQNLWVVNNDGTDERNLTTQRDFAGIEISDEMAPYVKGIVPSQVAWRPGTQTLYFNTAPQLDGPGLFLNDDLWAVDSNSGELTPVLAPDEGGNFYFSPDGSRLAIVTPGRLDLVDPDGGNRREGLTHTPVITYSEFEYYPSPTWAADSSSFIVAIPPVDKMAGDHQPTSIWLINDEGLPARLIGNLVTTGYTPPVFNAQLSQVAYLFGDGSTPGPDTPPPGLALAGIGEDGLGEAIIYSEEADALGEYSSDGHHFVYTPAGPEVPTRHVGASDETSLAIGDGQSAIARSDWVDANHLLFIQNNGTGWDILLTGINGSEPKLVDSVQGPPPATHFSGTAQ